MLKHSPFILCLLFFLGSHTALAETQYPQRIISLGPINTENVFLLGAGDRLVANTSYCVRPEAILLTLSLNINFLFIIVFV